MYIVRIFGSPTEPKGLYACAFEPTKQPDKDHVWAKFLKHWGNDRNVTKAFNTYRAQLAAWAPYPQSEDELIAQVKAEITTFQRHLSPGTRTIQEYVQQLPKCFRNLRKVKTGELKANALYLDAELTFDTVLRLYAAEVREGLILLTGYTFKAVEKSKDDRKVETEIENIRKVTKLLTTLEKPLENYLHLECFRVIDPTNEL